MANERILVVDDEKGVVRSCLRILQRQEYEVVGQTESATVPDRLRQETFDLLLTDIKMPKLDGLELLKIAKEIDPHISVVLITGYGTMEDAVRAIRLGAQGFLMKPFKPNELVTTVKNNLARRALLRDSLRLQTLLPLLEINETLQVSGEISLVRRVLEIAQREIGAKRIAWLSVEPASAPDSAADSSLLSGLVEAAVVPQAEPSHLPRAALETALTQGKPVWVLPDQSLVKDYSGHPNIVGAVLPLLIKGQVAGLLSAEIDPQGQTGPFGPLSLELLSLLTGQLAIVIENVQLFQQTETLRSFNEDIIENMTNGLIAVDEHSCITVFNPAAAAMLGCQPAQALNQPLSQALPGAQTLIDVFQETLKTGEPLSYREISITHPQGHLLPISISTAPLNGEEQLQNQGVVGVLEDLSEIKALEAERRRLDRLAALGEMAAVVAHEIRNPVAGIAAGVEYLTRNAPEGSLEYEGGAMIQGEIKRVNRIVEDILFVARPLQLDLTETELLTIIETVLKRTQPQIETSQVEVTTELDPNIPTLYLDSQRLEQVFSNLIINAVQAMPQGGKLWLQAALKPDASWPSYVQITVTDTGPGIPAEARQRIFEPFYTTKVRGTGLGLSVARRIIEEHGGEITVASEANQGTKFTITLPVQKRATS